MLSLLAIPLGIAPTLIWLFVYLRKDLHPEPRFMILLTFLGGMTVAPLALLAESGAMEVIDSFSFGAFLRDGLLIFGASAFIEEFLKFAVVRFVVIHSRAFDETVDAMIYLIITALGFAAIENILVLGPLLEGRVSEAFLTSVMRFWGANFLHALASGILGYFFVRGMWGWGLTLATAFHGFFNAAIVLNAETSFALVIFLLVGMAVLVSVFFKRLLRSSQALPLFLSR